MGLHLYPCFDGEFDDSSFDFDGASLAHNIDVLEEIAVSKGLKPIMAYADNREVPEDFDGDPDDLDEVMGPSDAWFPPLEGGAAARALADAIGAHAMVAKQLRGANDVVAELLLLSDMLQAAASKQMRFRLEIG